MTATMDKPVTKKSLEALRDRAAAEGLLDVAFTIEKGSPALIDLGEIHLEKATAESRNER